MADISIRKDARAGRITLQRPKALNALTYPMCLAIAEALEEWRGRPDIDVVVIDAEGERAFCAGGDIADMHRCGREGNFSYGRKYWRDEYRMNAAINEFPKPVVSFLQGFVMGGGVGVGCHGSHRITGQSSRIAMPECAIGLVPDVGGSYLLARGPGHIGECLGITGIRMDAADAIYAGFADHFIDEACWPDIKRALCVTGNTESIIEAVSETPQPRLAELKDTVDRLFSPPSLKGLVGALENEGGGFAGECLKRIRQNSPLSMACALALIRMQRQSPTLRHALRLEYRYVYRSLDQADFLEGIRARIIDKDNRPNWRHSDAGQVTDAEVMDLLAPLGSDELTWDQPPAAAAWRGGHGTMAEGRTED